MRWRKDEVVERTRGSRPWLRQAFLGFFSLSGCGAGIHDLEHRRFLEVVQTSGFRKETIGVKSPNSVLFVYSTSTRFIVPFLFRSQT
jgi:hypothetical protein